MTTLAPPARVPRIDILRTIALYKLVKVLLLLALAYGEVRLSDASLIAKLVTWASARPLGLEHKVVTWLLEWFSGLSAPRVHAQTVMTQPECSPCAARKTEVLGQVAFLFVSPNFLPQRGQ